VAGLKQELEGGRLEGIGVDAHLLQAGLDVGKMSWPTPCTVSRSSSLDRGRSKVLDWQYVQEFVRRAFSKLKKQRNR